MSAFATLRAWLPSWGEFLDGLGYVERESITPGLLKAENLPLSIMSEGTFFSEMSMYTGDHWEIPIIAVALYIVMIVVGPMLMEKRAQLPVNNLACAWNLLLSVFSFVGMLTTWSTIFSRVVTLGLESTVCGHPIFMAHGWIGWAMMLFIYSKLFELIDTFFLVAKKANLIFLHWYHHITVLLYCWHSYSVRIPSGIWFASMNYFVHAIMYFYFAMTQLGPKYRKMVRPYAQLITTLQISQMFVGLVVNALIIRYQSLGHKCYANKTNTILSWIMYASYFVLFGILYLKNYILGKPISESTRLKRD